MLLPFLRALSQRDFAMFWAGQTISLLGDGIFNVALAWQALELGSPAAALGIVLVARSGTRLVTLVVGGALADRYEKRLLMIVGDALQLVALAALAYIAAEHEVQIWHLSLVAGVTGIGNGILLSSSTAFLPELVGDDFLASANSLRSSATLLSSELLGPALGGVLVAATGTAAAFAIDAATFLASIVALLLIRPRQGVRTERGSTIFGDIKEGVRYVTRTPWIWVSLVAVGTIGNFALFGALPVLIPLFVRNELHEGAAALGFVWAGYGVGGLLGALTTGSLRIPVSSAIPAYAGWAVSCVVLALLALTHDVLSAAAVLAISGFTGHSAEVVWATLLQSLVPRTLLARVTSIDWLVSLTLQPAGLALAAPLSGALGVTTVLVAGAALATSAIGAGAMVKQVRRLPGVPSNAHGVAR